MTTKQLKDLIETPPVHRTPDYVPLCKLALEISEFADAANVPDNTDKRAMNFAYNVIDEIAAQVARAKAALALLKTAVTALTVPPADPPAKAGKKSATDPQ